MAQLTALRSRLSTLDPAAVRDRLGARIQTSPGRLTLHLVVLLVLGVLTGLSAISGAAQRGDLVDAVATRSGPLAVQAQQIYRSLSDADATAAAAFLTDAASSRTLPGRYRDDIAAASVGLASAVVTSDAERSIVTRIGAALPVYTGLIETAWTENLHRYPVGAAYLREASALMRGTLLPAANDLYQLETQRLAQDRDAAAAFPWLTVPLLLLTLAALLFVQRDLIRRTRRLVNVGLAGATAAALVLLLWVLASWIGVAANLAASDRDGSAQVQVLAQARIAALQARADEALTLVARGSGQAFEEDFTARMEQLIAADGRGGLLRRPASGDPAIDQALTAAYADTQAWRQQHATVRGLDDSGQYPQAVTIAAGDPKGITALFTRVDSDLRAAIAAAGRTFDDRAASAGGALTGAVAIWMILTVALLGGVVVGLQQRIAEYR